MISRLEGQFVTAQAGQIMLTQNMATQNQHVERLFLEVLKLQKQNDARLEALEENALRPKQDSVAATTSQQLKAQPPPSRGTVASTESRAQDSFGSVRMRFLRRRQCYAHCGCACHATTRFNTPRMFQAVLGSLFVGYTCIPRVSPACNDDDCVKSSDAFVQINYLFPQWLVARMVSAAMRFSATTGPEISLRTLNVRNPESSIFKAAWENDSDTVIRLLEEGHASVMDIASGLGHTPLHLAVIRSNVEVISVLMQYGAEQFLENATQEVPYDMAWATILCFENTPMSSVFRVPEIRKLFPSISDLQDRRAFTTLHQIVVGLVHMNLERELQRDCSTINQLDADGRTALNWAASRGDAHAVEVLLRYGATTKCPDRIGQGPLRSSLKASDPTCLRLLLKVGADVGEQDLWNKTVLQGAMHYNDPVPYCRPLIAAGIDLDIQDSTKSTALIEAVRMGHTDAVDMLVSAGADVNLRDMNGVTAMHEAVSRNSLLAARMLLKCRRVDHKIIDAKGQNVLHYAATSANIQMLQLLTMAKLEDIDIAAERDDGCSALDLAAKRWPHSHANDDDCDGEKPTESDDLESRLWDRAFQVLVRSVKARSNSPTPRYKDEEDRFTDYSATDSPLSSKYFDALIDV